MATTRSSKVKPVRSAGKDDIIFYTCMKCGERYIDQSKGFYVNHSELYEGNNYYLPVCKSCLETIYYDYVKETSSTAEATRRICMRFDYYWNPEVFKNAEASPSASTKSLILTYIRRVNIPKYAGMNYGTSIDESYDKEILNSQDYIEELERSRDEALEKMNDAIEESARTVEEVKHKAEEDIAEIELKLVEASRILSEEGINKDILQSELQQATLKIEEKNKIIEEKDKIIKEKDQAIEKIRSDFENYKEELESVENDIPHVPDSIKDFWGPGYDPEMYLELDKRYKYWTSKWEIPMDDPGVEALLRQICNLEISINYDRAAGKNVDKSVSTLNTLLGSANLKPVQKQETELDPSENMTFGEALKAWEDEQPLPEVDPDFKDIDGIGKYITVWLYGHLCKMMNIKNSYSKAYEDEIARLRVQRPEYEGEDDDSFLDEYFDDIFNSTSRGD